MDSGFAYTKKDGRLLKGDAELRKQVRPPKSVLGYCVPLALETNGKLCFLESKTVEMLYRIEKKAVHKPSKLTFLTYLNSSVVLWSRIKQVSTLSYSGNADSSLSRKLIGIHSFTEINSKAGHKNWSKL